MTHDEQVAWMRENGVKSMTVTWSGKDFKIVGIDLFPPELAAPFKAIAFEPDEPAPEEKPPGICVHPGCGEKNGWQFARDYCRDHGLAAAGVTRAR